jgi:hypothetical protein
MTEKQFDGARRSVTGDFDLIKRLQGQFAGLPPHASAGGGDRYGFLIW